MTDNVEQNRNHSDEAKNDVKEFGPIEFVIPCLIEFNDIINRYGSLDIRFPASPGKALGSKRKLLGYSRGGKCSSSNGLCINNSSSDRNHEYSSLDAGQTNSKMKIVLPRNKKSEVANQKTLDGDHGSMGSKKEHSVAVIDDSDILLPCRSYVDTEPPSVPPKIVIKVSKPSSRSRAKTRDKPGTAGSRQALTAKKTKANRFDKDDPRNKANFINTRGLVDTTMILTLEEIAKRKGLDAIPADPLVLCRDFTIHVPHY